MYNSYLPSTDAGRVVWLNTFSSRIANYSNELGLSPADIQSLANDALMYAYIVQLQDAIRQYWVTISGVKRALRNSPRQMEPPVLPPPPDLGPVPVGVRTGIFNRIVLLVASIRQNSNYTTAIAADLNIIPPPPGFSPDTAQPNLTLRLDAGFPLLRWARGPADAVRLYVDRRDGNGFQPLDKLIRNNYRDPYPLPKDTTLVIWDYKARYLVDDDEVGLFSPVLSIQVMR